MCQGISDLDHEVTIRVNLRLSCSATVKERTEDLHHIVGQGKFSGDKVEGSKLCTGEVASSKIVLDRDGDRGSIMITIELIVHSAMRVDLINSEVGVEGAALKKCSDHSAVSAGGQHSGEHVVGIVGLFGAQTDVLVGVIAFVVRIRIKDVLDVENKGRIFLSGICTE